MIYADRAREAIEREGIENSMTPLARAIDHIARLQTANPGQSHEQIKEYVRGLPPYLRQALIRIQDARMGDDALVALSELAREP